MNCLRLNQGFQTQQFEHRTGLAIDTLKPKIDNLTQRGPIGNIGPYYLSYSNWQKVLNSLLEVF